MHYRHLLTSPHLKSLQKLVIRDTRVTVSWKPILELDPEHFPNLTYLELPYNALFDYEAGDDSRVPVFPDLHLKYATGLSPNEDHCYWLNYRFYSKFDKLISYGGGMLL